MSTAIFDNLSFNKSRTIRAVKPKSRHYAPNISKPGMACIFEQLEAGKHLKAIAADLSMSYTTLCSLVKRAEEQGFQAWD